MMKLVVGGFAQGKLSYVLSQIPPGTSVQVVDENSYTAGIRTEKQEETAEKPVVIINHLHLIIRDMLDKGEAQSRFRDFLEPVLSQDAELIVIADELGCGIVPAEYRDRLYRETTGRLLCDLAKQAESVERIVCGIPQKIK